jgi:DNA-binding CsgD family transcriptional regulator
MDGDVSAELRKVANLLALREMDGKNKGEQARLLSTAGFANDEIARLVGISEGSVRAHLSQGRKRPAAGE